MDHCLALLELLSDIRLLDFGFRILDFGFMKGLESDLIQEKTTMGMAEGQGLRQKVSGRKSSSPRAHYSKQKGFQIHLI